jgi:hypothetical protein
VRSCQTLTLVGSFGTRVDFNLLVRRFPLELGIELPD